MTVHPIDTEALAKRAGHILFTDGPEQPAATARETCMLLDLLAAAEHRDEQLLLRNRNLLDASDRADVRIKAVRELHYPAHNSQDRTPFCPDCKGSPGVHECGCWRDEQETPVCGHCRGWKGVGPVEWPCPTIRALDGDA